MSKTAIVATDNRYLASMCAIARACADEVVVIAVGDRALAENAAKAGADQVRWHQVPDDVPAQAFAEAVAQWAQEQLPNLVLANDAPSARVILAATAGAIEAAVLGNVTDISASQEGFTATCKVAGGIALQEVHAPGRLAAVYEGAEFAEATGGQAPIEAAEVEPTALRVVERKLPSDDAVDLSSAIRIVGVGRGVKSADFLPSIEELANHLGAAMACTLPISEDSHWYPPEQVLGSSHNSAAPELYIALGVSGSPNHLSGVKDARVVVAVNNDPEAEVFKHCDYGVIADLNEFVSALMAAMP